jgi:hypothetical protein
VAWAFIENWTAHGFMRAFISEKLSSAHLIGGERFNGGRGFVSGDFVSEFGFHELMACFIYLGCAFWAKLIILYVNVKEANGFPLL